MRNQTKSGGFNKTSTLDTNTPGTSASSQPSLDHSDLKGKLPSLQHIDPDYRFRSNMIPKRHPMFPMNGPHRMMPPNARHANRMHSPNVMFRGRAPNMMPGRSMFQGPGAQMGMAPPGGFMAPMQHRPKESENIQPQNEGQGRMSGFTQRQEEMPKDSRGFPGKMMDFHTIPGQPKHGGPMRMHTGPMGMQSGPMGMRSGPMGMHSGPMGKQSGPMKMHSGPIGMHSGPMGMQSGPMGMQGGPMGKQSGPMGMHSGPIGVQSNPMGKQSGPMGMHGGPMRMQSGLMGMRGGTMGKQSGPMGMQSGPMGIHGPMGMQGGPMGILGSPMGKQSSPMRMHSGTMRMQSGPMRMRSGPMGMKGGPMGMQSGLMRMRSAPMGMHAFGMNKTSGQQGKPMGRFPRGLRRHMMPMPLSYKRMIRFPERYMDLSGYTMDFKGRFVNQQGKHVNPLHSARMHQGRAMMPAPLPIKRRFMQKPERYMDLSRYTMDFEGRYRDRYGRQIDPMEQFNANIDRYVRNLPPVHRRMVRFPERYMDLSRYTMDFQGRFMDSHGRHIDPFGRIHGNYGKILMSPPLNQRRFTRQPEKYMDMSGYTMDFQGRFLDRRGRPVDLLGQHHRHPERFMPPVPYMQQPMPMMPRKFPVVPPFKPMDMSQYTMDFQGRLMDNQGQYVDHMRRFGDHMGPHPPHDQRNLMEFSRYPMDFQDRHFDKYSGPFDRVYKPNTSFERCGSPERGQSPGPETNIHIESRQIIPEKEYTELKSSPGFNRVNSEMSRPSSSGEQRTEMQYGPQQGNVLSAPPDMESYMFPPIDDEHMQMPFMPPPMFPPIHASMHQPMYSSEKPRMHYPTPEDDPQMQQHMVHFEDEMHMPMQKPFTDDMMMMKMVDMPNAGYQQYQWMDDPFMFPESEYMTDDRQWHSDDGFDYIDDEMPYEYSQIPNMMAVGMHGRPTFRIDEETRDQSHLPPVIGSSDSSEIGRDERCDNRMGYKHMHSMEDREFDSRHGRFETHDDIDYPGFMQDMHQRPMSEFFDHCDSDDGMFDDDYYMDNNMDEDFFPNPRSSMAYPSMGFMNDFQMPFSFDPEYMGMQSGFMPEPEYYPYPYMDDYFGYGFDDDDSEDEREREEEEEESRHRSMKHQTSSSLHRAFHSHGLYHGNMNTRQGVDDVATGIDRPSSLPRIVLSEDKPLVDDKHARYLEDAAEYLKERSRFLRDQHNRFVQELENAGPLKHPQVQAEAEAHANEVKEEVNATEAEAEAVERLARTARRLSNVDHQLAANRHPSLSA